MLFRLPSAHRLWASVPGLTNAELALNRFRYDCMIPTVFLTLFLL
jgi:hypothetical protein